MLQNGCPPYNIAQCIFAAVTELVLTRSKFANRPTRHAMLVTLFVHTHNQHSSHRGHTFITILSHLSFTCVCLVVLIQHKYDILCKDIDVLKCYSFAVEI